MDAHSIHVKEEQARESGNFLEALRLSDEATLLYQKEGDVVGLAEIQSARFEIFKHLFFETNDKSFLILGKMSAKAGVKIAENSGKTEALAIPLFCLAKALTLLKKHEKAQEKYQEALEVLPQSHQNRPSVEADIKIHKAICSIEMGNSGGENDALQAISDLEGSDEQKYEKDVWISGAYLKLAEALSSREYLEKAKAIIDASPELVLRKKQLEKLTASLFQN